MHGTLLELRANCLLQTTLELGPLPLASGNYSIYFWLIKPWAENYHIVKEPLHFFVELSDPGSVGFDFKQAYGRGAVTLPLCILS